MPDDEFMPSGAATVVRLCPDPIPTPVAAPVADDEAAAVIGARLRALRLTQGLTVAALSERTGVSAGAISHIERGTTSPSIRTLMNITNTLGVSFGDLFADVGQPGAASLDFVIRKQARKHLRFWRTGISKELLTDVTQIDIEVLMLTIEPGGDTGEAYIHRGEEAGVLLEGELRLTVDGETALLREGDSFGFASDRPHSFRNPSAHRPARVLWINTGNHKEL